MTSYPGRTRPGVTIVEVLVTIAATAILTGLLLFGIRAVRGQSLAMKDLHNLRLSGQDLLIWSVENDGKVLNIESPNSRLFQQAYPGLTPDFNLYLSLYFSQFVNWPEFLEAVHGLKREHWQTAYRPGHINGPEGAPPDLLQRQHFQLSPTLHTSPDLWADPTPAASALECAPYIQSVRFSEVRHPSSKGMIAHLDIPQRSDVAHILFVDSSARRIATHLLHAPTNNPRSRSRGPGRPVLHTLDGHYGRDQ
ncbi:MAG: type II secretion system protein [Phycisphaerales bacterium]